MNSPLDLPPDLACQALNHARPVQGPRWRSDGLFDQLGARFAVPVPTHALPDPVWVARNHALAAELGLGDWLQTGDALATLSGQTMAQARLPLASVYSGHQFGVWAGRLGDGRAHLLGEIDTPAGDTQELQLKGAGLTPFSRMGDGRAVLRSSIREYLCSEAMAGLGIPTTRALALVGSPLPVRRERVETAAIVTRVAPSFLRFGHFEHFAHTARDVTALAALREALVRRHFPALADQSAPTLALLAEVARRTAELMAAWQAVGFCHGVMNTDNMSMLGLTIDYGPFGFLDGYDPGHICNHSDHQGRYAYARQPQVALWNLHALAQGLLPLVAQELGEPAASEAPGEAALEALEVYRATFPQAMRRHLRAKLGLALDMPEREELDDQLCSDWLRLLAAERTDHSVAMRRLGELPRAEGAACERLGELFIDRAALDAWLVRYRQRLACEQRGDAERRAAMDAVNPKYILRNHLAETAIRQAEAGDFDDVQRLARVLERPYDEQPEHASYAGLAPDWASTLEISCSS